MTDEEADEKEKREDEANAGRVTEGAGCCLIELLFASTAFAGLTFLPFRFFG